MMAQMCSHAQSAYDGANAYDHRAAIDPCLEITMPYWLNLDTMRSFGLALGANVYFAELIGGMVV